MEILFVLTLIWVVVTLVGHLTWVIVAATLRALFGSQPNQTKIASTTDDVAAAQRVINRLASALLISPQEAKQLRQKLGALDQPVWKKQQSDSKHEKHDQLSAAERAYARPVDTGDSGTPASHRDVVPAAADPDRTVAPKVGPAPLHPLDELIAARDQVSGFPPASAAHPVPEPESQSDDLQSGGHVPEVLTGTPQNLVAASATESSEDSNSQPLKTPRASAGRSLAEFLADHNIRWGELIAGLLIVVCSIGLVVSLWSTLTQTHRVVPSLIFLGGNTAIFLAGLYTLFRWKLQDSSRATLVIATLLVPLGILAGLSTGSGIDSAAVMLNDPITLICIAGAGTLYSFLLWHSSRALVGRKDAMAMTIGVAGPSAVLPLIPAALRTFGDASGFVCYLGSLAASISVIALFRHRSAARGNAANRRAMVLGVTAFSLAVLSGYTAMMLRELETGWLAVAVASLPGVLVLAAATWTFSRDHKRPKLGLAGTVFGALGIFAATSLIVPMMVSSAWLWMWAISFTLAAAISAWATRSSWWTVIATVPVGLALVLSSPSLASAVPWNEFPIRNRFLGGEPMIAAFVFGVMGIVAAAGLSQCIASARQLSKLLVFASVGWIGVSIINAVLLTFAPSSWMGIVPAWWCSVFLAGYSIATTVVVPQLIRTNRLSIDSHTINRAINNHYFALVGIVLQWTFWFSVFKPFALGATEIQINALIRSVGATALGAVLAAEWSWRIPQLSKAYRQLASTILAIVTCLTVFALFTTDRASEMIGMNHHEAIMTLVIATVVWLWIGLSQRDGVHFALARGCLCLTAGLVGHIHFNELLFTVDSWRSGQAFWGWSGLGISLVGMILLRSQLLILVQRAFKKDSSINLHEIETLSSWRADLKSRLAWYHPHEHAADVASTGWIWIVSLVLMIAAAFLGASMLVVQVAGGTAWVIDQSLALPLAVFAGSGLVYLVFAAQRFAPVSGQKHIGAFYGASLCTWIGWQVAINIADIPGDQLVWGTSIAAGGCFALGLIFSHRWTSSSITHHSITHHLLDSIGLIWVIASSFVLLKSSWWMAVVQQETPDQFITCAVAAWWITAAIVSAWQSIRHHSKDHGTIVAVLVPAVVILVCPLWNSLEWWVWIQSAGCASIGLAIASHLWNLRWNGNDSNQDVHPGIRRIAEWSFVFGSVVGIVTNVGVMAGVIIGEPSWIELHNPIGLAASLLTIGMLTQWNHFRTTVRLPLVEIHWPMTFTLASGHLAILGHSSAGIDLSAANWLPIIWTGTAVVAGSDLVCRVVRQQAVDRPARWHACGLIVATSTLCLFHGGIWHRDLIGVIACSIGGLLVALRSTYAYRQEAAGETTSRWSVVAARIFCWFVIVVGAIFVVDLVVTTSFNETRIFTALIVWFATWAIIWRGINPEGAMPEGISLRPGSMLADIELSWLVVVLMIAETVATLAFPKEMVSFGLNHDRALWIRGAAVIAVLVSAGLRHRRKSVLENAATGTIALAVLIGLRLGIDRSAEPPVLICLAGLVTAATYSILVFSISTIRMPTNLVARYWRGLNPATASRGVGTSRIIRSLVHLSPLVILVTVVNATWLLIEFNQQRIVPVAICAVALTAICLAELAERLNRTSLRHIAVTIAMASVAMWASCRVEVDSFPLLSLSTRWFVAWVILAVMLAFALPKLIPDAIFMRWRNALRRGWCVAIALATGSLVATLIQQAMIRVSGQTELLNRPLYLGMAVTLATLCVASTLAGILSGPGFSYRQSWGLTNRQRAALVVAAQTLGGLTWFHLFLCKSPLASLGLRAYWPYIVITLSFSSVGITEWARRRGDDVLASTLRKTALFLPLVPVFGFWLSGSWVTSMFGESDSSGWTFIQGKVSYQVILVAAALYYGVVSFLWKNGRARLVSVILGNLALWVILIQTPNWDFLSHPQAWLIPPAVCVLVAAHFYRETLGAKTASGIRYAATLSIYITSTADMLVQGIGETIWGPIVLILLALIGAIAGVALRIRPFLYLGTTFVFLGVTSMVWHAQTQIGAVWPWWVFGISTGVMLMVGLMAIEKNKPKLRQIASSLQQWEA